MLPYVLFAYRQVPQESTGIDPFDLLNERKVRGPLELRDLWKGDTEAEGEPVTEYVQRF